MHWFSIVQLILYAVINQYWQKKFYLALDKEEYFLNYFLDGMYDNILRLDNLLSIIIRFLTIKNGEIYYKL